MDVLGWCRYGDRGVNEMEKLWRRWSFGRKKKKKEEKKKKKKKEKKKKNHDKEKKEEQYLNGIGGKEGGLCGWWGGEE